MKSLIATFALALSLAAAPVMATENPFSMDKTATMQMAESGTKCGESMKKETGKCGGPEMKECMETKTREECAKEGKCGDGKCGEGVKKEPEKKDTRCGAGKCGANMKKQ